MKETEVCFRALETVQSRILDFIHINQVQNTFLSVIIIVLIFVTLFVDVRLNEV